jgi:hypothetical protein
MTKTLRNKLIELNGKKVRLTTTNYVYENYTLEVNYDNNMRYTQRKPNSMNVILIRHNERIYIYLNKLVDVEEL